METEAVFKCPECNHKQTGKAGFRYLENNVTIQRFRCKKCGYRFSDPAALNVQDTNNANSQISAFKVKNLASAQKTKTCAGNERIPQETRGLIVKFIAYLEREGYYEGTSYLNLISSIATDGANLLTLTMLKLRLQSTLTNSRTAKRENGETAQKSLQCKIMTYSAKWKESFGLDPNTKHKKQS